VDFTLRSGEVHALMGQNGAGKSTLIKALTGVHRPEAGTIRLRGTEIRPESPEHAQELGIATVYQEVNLCPNLTVAENLLLGREPRGPLGIDWKAMNARAKALVKEKLDLDLDPARELSSYSLAIQQMVALARALCVRSDVLILDEPTSSLDEAEVERLFATLRRLKAEGLAIVFVTHFLDQVYAISDRITVLRNGELVGEAPAEQLPKLALIGMMVGKDPAELAVGEARPEKASEAGPETLSAAGLGRAGYLKPFDLTLRKGEVLGLAGLLGSGRTEMAKLLFGAERATEGKMEANGKSVRLQSPRDAIGHGIGFCPEDRKTEGLIGDLSIRENIALALQAKRGILRFLGKKKQEELADKYIRALDIKTPDSDRPARTLSGGNQQKVLLARWLATEPTTLILDEPTRGIDVAAKGEILRRIRSLRDGGMSIVFISSELEEVAAASDRVAVLRDKKKVAEVAGGEVEESKIMKLIAHGEAVNGN
jgi:simple sugar transport system ATP-binding protein